MKTAGERSPQHHHHVMSFDDFPIYGPSEHERLVCEFESTTTTPAEAEGPSFGLQLGVGEIAGTTVALVIAVGVLVILLWYFLHYRYTDRRGCRKF